MPSIHYIYIYLYPLGNLGGIGGLGGISTFIFHLHIPIMHQVVLVVLEALED